MKKNKIETPRFADENALNIFLANVADMRAAQKRLEHLEERQDIGHMEHRRRTREKELLEKQVDDALKAMPPITALFF